ncbi:MOSC N-terminal beta barrel domain-containing protein [Opitutus sp. ER46]|uniref:MOSC domain-containing protein n=1 Tax=Opitutus sp. ER46 TaxID=2161864 RepID=UPI000D302396|nr:MOSC N-terminal beta barrel domain-containing protein [Opitutus sp. ER46]PTX91693.1 molybdenum cofactor biosysynthesis protein [Opitutus sp. ER46]
MHVSGLFIYPVKSLRGIAVSSATVDALGLVGDRRFLVVDADGQFLTQRTLPRMALISTALSNTHLTLDFPGHGPTSIPLRAADDNGPTRPVTIWKHQGLEAEDCGEGVATWLTGALGTACRLVRIGKRFHRPVLKAAGKPGDVFAFADAVPFLVISEASLIDLNHRLLDEGQAMVPMDRFRPNLVVADATAYAEDQWPHVRVGGIMLRAAGPCARCVVVTTDQNTAKRGKEPLRLLATYRRDSADSTRINFGQNFIHETRAGTLRVGDPVVPA